MPLQVQYATPIGSNALRVVFDLPVRQMSRLGPNSALLRDNYEVSVLSGGGGDPVVERVDPDGTSAVSVSVDRRLLVRSTYRVVVSTAVEAIDGSTMTPPANQADFPGIYLPRERVVQKPVQAARGVDLRYDTFTGRFVFDSSGDIDTHSGAAAAEKRVVRRLLSTPGGFRHLSGYGVGLRVKEPMRSTDIAQVRLDALDQVRKESDIRDPEIDAEAIAGVLWVRVRGRVASSPIAIEVPFEE